MVNTLANHGFLPRNGVNVSLADLQYAFNASLNLEPSATQLVGAPALLTSTTGNASTFNLDNLDTHDSKQPFFPDGPSQEKWLTLLLSSFGT